MHCSRREISPTVPFPRAQWSLHVLDRLSEPIGTARCTSANKENSNPALTLTSTSAGSWPVLVYLLPSSNSKETPVRGGRGGAQTALRCFGLAQILIDDTSSKIRCWTPATIPICVHRFVISFSSLLRTVAVTPPAGQKPRIQVSLCRSSLSDSNMSWPILG